MNGKNSGAIFTAIFIVFIAGVVGGIFLGKTSFANTSELDSGPGQEAALASVPVAEPGSAVDSVASVAESGPGVPHDSASVANSDSAAESVAAVARSFEPWIHFFEAFQASYRDSAFTGDYQLVFPVMSPLEGIRNSKFERLLFTKFFGKKAPKTLDRKSIQAALDGMMRTDVKNTHDWWDESKVTYGERWRDEVCGCSAYFYTMPTDRSLQWMSFQQIRDSRCGGNGGPDEDYYTVINVEEPYIMDTSAFVPGFREKLVDMVTDNVIYNFYLRRGADDVNRDDVRQASVDVFKGDFVPSLTLSGVKFIFPTWSLPRTCHADGQVSVIVPYRTIQEIFTLKFKTDIGL